MSRSATIRGSTAEGPDAECINRLAALTGRQAPDGPLLLAEVGGDPVAAIGIFDGHTISDPGRSSLALMMRLHILRVQLRLAVAVWGI